MASRSAGDKWYIRHRSAIRFIACCCLVVACISVPLKKGCKNPVAVKADRLTKLVLLVSLLMDGRFTVLVEINFYLIVSSAQALKQSEQIQPFSHVCRCAICASLIPDQHPWYNAGSW